jgi:hypothetical protein
MPEEDVSPEMVERLKDPSTPVAVFEELVRRIKIIKELMQ